MGTVIWSLSQAIQSSYHPWELSVAKARECNLSTPPDLRLSRPMAVSNIAPSLVTLKPGLWRGMWPSGAEPCTSSPCGPLDLRDWLGPQSQLEPRARLRSHVARFFTNASSMMRTTRSPSYPYLCDPFSTPPPLLSRAHDLHFIGLISPPLQTAYPSCFKPTATLPIWPNSLTKAPWS